MTDSLLVNTAGAVEWVTLNRPEALNAMNASLVDALVDYFTQLRHRTEVRVVVLRANGRAFCAGLDMANGGFGLDAGASPQRLYEGTQKRIGDIYRAMRRCPQPIIALVHGAACGGGFSLALAADIRIAGESAKMNAAYIKIGLGGCDMASSYFLPRLVGLSVASELLLTGRFIYAQRALAVNLVSEVVPDDQLEVAAQSYIDDMLSTAPLGLRMSKDALNLSIDSPSMEAAMAVEDRQQALLSLTADAGEAQRAFLEKRPPSFSDR